jgi:cystathionine gamma-synthase
MVSIVPDDGPVGLSLWADDLRRAGDAVVRPAESLGGVESLIEVPAAMTHMSVAGSPLEVDPALIRLSVGIEAVDDLIADLRVALDEA